MKDSDSKVNTIDPDAHIMQFSDKIKKPTYNGEVVVDGKANVIVAKALLWKIFLRWNTKVSRGER